MFGFYQHIKCMNKIEYHTCKTSELKIIKGAIARKRQVFEKMAQKSKTAFHWLKIRHWNALAHCARSYSRADA